MKRIKLCYSDPQFLSVEVEATETWSKILAEQNQPQEVIQKALIQGSLELVELTTTYWLETTYTHLSVLYIIL